MFFFGIDWSDDHHNLCIRNAQDSIISRLEFKHSLKGFLRLDDERRKLGVATNQCLVAIETDYNLIIDFLMDRGYVVYLIPPQATASYRNRHRSSGAHSDVSDAALLSRILLTDRDSHRQLMPNSALTQQILAHIRLIETLPDSIQRQSNHLRALLARTYPQALNLFGRLKAPISLHFLMAYPTAHEAQALSHAEFDAFCPTHKYRRHGLISHRYAHLMEPAPQANPIPVAANREPIRILAQLNLIHLRHRPTALSCLNHLFAQHPDAFLFDSLPGAGQILAPPLLAKFGHHPDRFPTANSVQALASTCPVTQQSGKRKIVFFRRGCNREFRRIVQQFARASVNHSGWASAYWHQVRPRCRSDSDAYRRLGNRCLAIIWRMWQDRRAYDETYHLRQRAQRQRPKA